MRPNLLWLPLGALLWRRGMLADSSLLNELILWSLRLRYSLQGLPGNLATGYNDMNAEFMDRESLRHFTRITSNIYRQLGTHFEEVFEEWARPEEIEEVEP